MATDKPEQIVTDVTVKTIDPDGSTVSEIVTRLNAILGSGILLATSTREITISKEISR
ncbi:MAG: hypothetical protein O3A00_16810 [Planctomycetota bacterium]|nr:hypothetical protein [Planctomycetota bacterium]